MDLDVCLCTHNPRPDTFRRVLEALARQTYPVHRFRVWIVDNCCDPPITEAWLGPLQAGGITWAIVREPRLGIAYAREQAIRATTGEWVVFVDDDNELFDDYLTCAAAIVRAHPRLGCFGGKLLLPLGSRVARWARPLLPYLAIKDHGEAPITRYSTQWGKWEPPTAGAVVCRRVLDLYVESLARWTSLRLGRKGRNGLLSAEDSLMMRGAVRLQLQCSYQPQLRLWHHIDPARLKFLYLMRLLYSYGRSDVLLEHALGNRIGHARPRHLLRLLTQVPKSREGACRLAHGWGFYVESLKWLGRRASQAVDSASS